MAKFEKRLKAIKLRREGLSIKTIAENLSVSKGTASVWCRNIQLTKKQKEKLKSNMIKAGHKGRMIGAEMNHKKKLDIIAFFEKSGKKDIGKLSQRDLLIAGIALYWAEGSKSEKSHLSLINSDPNMITFAYKWFRKSLGVKKNEFMPRIFINQMHRPRIDSILKYWAALLDLPKEQFGNPVFLKIKQKKVYDNYDSYNGILALRIKNGTNLKYKILGLIKAFKI